MDVELGIVLLRRGRATAQVRRGAVAFVAKRLAGKRVVGERHRTFGELRRQRAVVLGGVKAKGLDVSQQGNPLVEPRLRRANRVDARYEDIREQCRRAGQLVLLSQRLGLPDRDIDDLHDIVDADVVLALLVQKDDLIDRKPQDTLFGKANLDETLACGA